MATYKDVEFLGNSIDSLGQSLLKRKMMAQQEKERQDQFDLQNRRINQDESQFSRTLDFNKTKESDKNDYLLSAMDLKERLSNEISQSKAEHDAAIAAGKSADEVKKMTGRSFQTIYKTLSQGDPVIANQTIKAMYGEMSKDPEKAQLFNDALPGLGVLIESGNDVFVPTAIPKAGGADVIKDAQGNPITGPDGKPIYGTVNPSTGNVRPLKTAPPAGRETIKTTPFGSTTNASRAVYPNSPAPSLTPNRAIKAKQNSDGSFSIEKF